MCCMKCRFEKCQSVGMTRKVINLKPFSRANLKETSIIQYFNKIIETNCKQLERALLPENESIQSNICSRKRRFATDLTAHEWSLIEKVRVARSVFSDELSVPMIRPTSNVFEIFKIPDIYFQWTVKFCKQFDQFTSLSNENQFNILKPFCFDALAIHFSFIYDTQKNGYPMFEVSAL